MMKRIWMTCVAGIAMLAGAVSAWGLQPAGPELTEVCVKQICFFCEVASTPEARQMGLMFRKELPANQGMLFVFERPGAYTFWMQNMSFPIDILWVNGDKQVVDIKTKAPVCKTSPCPLYTPLEPALFVIELPAGTVDRTGMAVGDSVTIGQ